MRHDSTPAPLDESFAYEMIDRALEAYNAHDAERFAELGTEDVIYHHSAAPTATRGHAQVRAFYSDSWKAFPDGRAELHDGPFLHPRAPRFSNVWRWTGTHTGPLERMGLAATGKRVELLAFEVVEVRDGLASSVRIVENMADVMAQLGLLPTPGSGA